MKNMETSKDGQSSHESVGVTEKSRDGLFVRLNEKRAWSFLKTQTCHFGGSKKGPEMVLSSSDGDGIDSNEVVRETAVRWS